MMPFKIVRTAQSVTLPTAPDQHITLLAWGVQFRWRRGLVAWYRPLAVEIQQRNGVQRLPIADVMLRTNLALVLAALASIALSWWWQHLFARRRQ